jgi:hypothetical protein
MRHLNDFTKDEVGKMLYNEKEWNARKQKLSYISLPRGHFPLQKAQALSVVWNLAHLKATNDESETSLVQLQLSWKSRIYNGVSIAMLMQKLLLLCT